MSNINQSALTVVRQLIGWYDRDEADDDELEQIITQARDVVERTDPDDQCGSIARGRFVLYDFDHEDLASTEVYPSFSAAAADAEGLNCVLILKLPVPVLASAEPEVTDDDDLRCECELPGFFCCGIPGILAHLERGRVAQGAKVERCDQCQRYESDEVAQQKLIELGIL